jgi:L-2-hydroxyglutarate oxidase LhgO
MELGNIRPMLAVARKNLDLEEYLVGQVLQTESHQFATLKQFFPHADRRDWRKAVAGQRVQIIKPDPKQTGVLEKCFADELASGGWLDRLITTSVTARRSRTPNLGRRPRALASPLVHETRTS